jgi:hypothetical protein
LKGLGSNPTVGAGVMVLSRARRRRSFTRARFSSSLFCLRSSVACRRSCVDSRLSSSRSYTCSRCSSIISRLSSSPARRRSSADCGALSLPADSGLLARISVRTVLLPYRGSAHDRSHENHRSHLTYRSLPSSSGPKSKDLIDIVMVFAWGVTESSFWRSRKHE